MFHICFYVSKIGKIGSKSDVYRRLPKFYNFATFSLKILCLFHRVHVIILITSVSRNTVNKIDGKTKGVNVKKVLVTGGSGFVGRKLICELLNRYPDIEITSMSRSEGVISKLLTECPDKRLKISITDVRDSEAVKQVLRDKDTVFHLAAMKRVDLSEVECRLAVTINVLGTMNILDAFHGKTFILMSTDKAVEPVNCYGATKLVAERIGDGTGNEGWGRREVHDYPVGEHRGLDGERNRYLEETNRAIQRNYGYRSGDGALLHVGGRRGEIILCDDRTRGKRQNLLYAHGRAAGVKGCC